MKCARNQNTSLIVSICFIVCAGFIFFVAYYKFSYLKIKKQLKGKCVVECEVMDKNSTYAKKGMDMVEF